MGATRTLKRRRLEGKTDYGARLSLLKSEKTRVVVRKTNRYIIAQIVESDSAQDKVIVGVSSKDLLNNGWPKEAAGSLKSLSAAYLTGFLLGVKMKGKVKEAILDMGMHRNVNNSRVYAVLKGLVESGLNIPHGKEALPSDENIRKNEKVGKLVDKLKEKLK